MTSFLITALFVITILCNSFCSARQVDLLQRKSAMASRNHLFANNLFLNIVDNRPEQKIVISPASIHASLALVYLGAEGITGEEIRKALNITEENKEQFASLYGDLLESTFGETNAADDALQLKMANRLYVSNNIKIVPSFNELAQKNFGCEAENVNFSDALTAVENINEWVEQQTANKIKDLLQSNAVDAETSAVLVNAIYFKAEWVNTFDMARKGNFYISDGEKVKVDLMYNDDRFSYVELPNAKALKMLYKNSDISMMVILPDEGVKLEDFTEELKTMDFNNIASQMTEKSVKVILPKFRIESEIDLKEPLRQLGIVSVFGNKANLTGMFDSEDYQKISDVKHKAYFDCNEAGSEAAAATNIKFIPLSINPKQKTFRANRPFAFVVHNKNAIFFAGLVINPL